MGNSLLYSSSSSPALDYKSFLFGRWERQYIAKNGGAVKVILHDEEGAVEDKNDTNYKTTTFFFSSNDPQKVSDILNNNNKFEIKIRTKMK